jgi:hypothetical protein
MSGLHFLVLPVILLRHLFFTSPNQTLLRIAPAAEDAVLVFSWVEATNQ